MGRGEEEEEGESDGPHTALTHSHTGASAHTHALPVGIFRRVCMWPYHITVSPRDRAGLHPYPVHG